MRGARLKILVRDAGPGLTDILFLCFFPVAEERVFGGVVTGVLPVNLVVNGIILLRKERNLVDPTIEGLLPGLGAIDEAGDEGLDFGVGMPARLDGLRTMVSRDNWGTDKELGRALRGGCARGNGVRFGELPEADPES